MQKYQNFDLVSKISQFLLQRCHFWGKNWRAGLTRLKFLSHIDQIICKNNYQNIVFVSEALHGEITIWNNQIFEEGYLSHPKYLGGLFYLTFNSSPNRSQNTIESYYGYDCSWLKWSNIQWKWKRSNIFLKYLSSEIMELKKIRGEVHILLYGPIDTFQWG